MHVVICGGGVIGASIAYFLGLRGIGATVVERTGIACAASGKSGGVPAGVGGAATLWRPRARRSFDLHAELADRLGNDWGYRRLTTWGGVGGHGRLPRRTGADVGWLSDRVAVTRTLGSPETTAQ